ncbi:MAG TPA: hypothetical protein VME18_12265 [Acidobacteriaceae bacterium]|nr:hypothetical protein [Acidobacteriaceae bacterium]
MTHLSQDELIELYYGEGAGSKLAHQQACRECTARLAELKQSLDAIRSAPAAPRRPDYAEQVWEALRPRLVPYEKKARRWRGSAQWRAMAVVLGGVLLLAGGFLGGRYWERITAEKAHLAGSAGRQANQRVVLVMVTDHLDRSERLLTALEHADPSDRVEIAQLQSEAQQLLASNRLYRATASKADDPLLAATLEQLEGVLAEIADDPHLTPTDLRSARREMNAEGILFEIRVLIASRPGEVREPNHAKGASI